MSNTAITRWRVRTARRWLIPASIWSLLIGFGTLDHYAGHPDDAPHLHLSDHVRGWMWVVFSLISFAILIWDRKGSEMATRLASAFLMVMPAVRAVSYTFAFWLSVGGKDSAGVGPWWDEGDPTAWYTCLPWWLIVWAILSQAIEVDLLRKAAFARLKRLVKRR